MENELKKVTVPVSGSDDEATRELIAKLKKNGSILALLERSGIPYEYLEKRPWTFKRWLDGTAVCAGCKGLKDCRQPVKGYYKDLLFEGILVDALSPCRYQKEKNRSEKHLSNYLISDLPSHLNTVGFDTLTYEKNEQEYLQAVRRCMKAASEGRGVYLYGSMGSGKTYLAACACNMYAKKGEKTAFIHYPSFCARMARSVGGNEYESEVGKLKYARLLVIDDIGAETVTEWNRDAILLPLLNSRYEDGLPTWFTSNEDMKSLRQHLMYTNRGKEEEIKAERIMERIRCMCEAVELNGKDRRTDASHANI